ncbi:hypothetical protein, partial [Xanthomonas fragariae]
MHTDILKFTRRVVSCHRLPCALTVITRTSAIYQTKVNPSGLLRLIAWFLRSAAVTRSLVMFDTPRV